MPATHLALLRGINVGGKNKLPMKGLAEIFAKAGCADVRTYIQSGNVIFTCAEADAEKLPFVVSAAIARRFGLKVPVVMRTAAELGKILHGNPFLAAGTPEGELHVMFLAAAPSKDDAAKLNPRRTSSSCAGAKSICGCPTGAQRASSPTLTSTPSWER